MLSGLGELFLPVFVIAAFVVLLFYVSDIKKAVEQLFLPPTYSIKQDKQNADCTISLYIAVRAALDISRVWLYNCVDVALKGIIIINCGMSQSKGSEMFSCSSVPW